MDFATMYTLECLHTEYGGRVWLGVLMYLGPAPYCLVYFVLTIPRSAPFGQPCCTGNHRIANCNPDFLASQSISRGQKRRWSLLWSL
eukprot:5858709-Amphidinium_carterae.1